VSGEAANADKPIKVVVGCYGEQTMSGTVFIPTDDPSIQISGEEYESLKILLSPPANASEPQTKLIKLKNFLLWTSDIEDCLPY
jgi:hypothetical protein